MLAWLHQLPNFMVAGLALGSLVGGVVLAPLLLTRLLGLPRDGVRNRSALEAFKAVSSFAVLILAFSLSNVQADLGRMSQLVAQEANAFTHVDRVLIRHGSPDLLALRPSLLAYGQAILHDEWPRMARNQGRSARVDEIFGHISQEARTIEPASTRQQLLLTQALQNLDALSDLREQRLAGAAEGLPGLFWVTVFSLCLLLIGIAALVVPSTTNLLLVGAISTGIALLLALVIVIDHPFSGETSVSGQPIANAVLRAAQRER